MCILSVMKIEKKLFNPLEALYDDIVSGKSDDEVELVTDCCSAHYDEPLSQIEGTDEMFARCNACGEMATVIDLAKEE